MSVRVPLQACLPHCQSQPCVPEPHLSAAVGCPLSQPPPGQPLPSQRQQVAGQQHTGAALQGMWGWSRLFPPPAAGWAGWAWEEGWVEGGSKHSHVQLGLSKRSFLLPPVSRSSNSGQWAAQKACEGRSPAVGQGHFPELSLPPALLSTAG